MEKECEWCGKLFTPKTKQSRYCYDTHYKECENCGESFPIKEMKRPKKTCSKKCADDLTSSGSIIIRTCELCGTDFETINRRARFCHADHYEDCKVCGTEFTIANPHSPSSTCSPQCAWQLVDDVDSVTEKRKQTMLDNHGVENPSQSDEFKDAKKKTLMRNHGVENPSQSEEVKEKRRQSFLDAFGVDNPMRDERVREKLNRSILDKYGVENAFQNPDIQKRSKKTLEERYGVDNISKHPENREKVKSSTLAHFGVESVLTLPENQLKASKSNGKRISKVNKKWRTTLFGETGIEFDGESLFGDNSFADFGHKDILIDINPTFTHNSTISYSKVMGRCTENDCTKNSHQPRTPGYHQNRALSAEQDGKLLLQYFDWMDPGIFLSIVKAKLHLTPRTIPAKKTVLREIRQAEANVFLRENHLMGASNKQTLCLGLYHDDELVHVQTYGRARISRKAEWEAIRSCSKLDYRIVGGFSKCDKHFFKTIDPESVVSYVDLNISQGHTDSMFDGWRLESVNNPNITWVKLGTKDTNYPRFIRDNTARRVSADRLLGFEVGDKYPRYDNEGNKVSNADVLLNEGYVKVHDAGTKTFLWRR